MPARTVAYSSYPSYPTAVPSKSHYQTSPAPVRLAGSYGRSAGSAASRSGGSSIATSAVPSLTSASYGEGSIRSARSSVYDSERPSAHSVDLMDMMNTRMSHAVSTLPMDRGIARQAQTSGELNAKQRELAELQALAQRRLKTTRTNMADGMRAAKEVRKDLEWTSKRVSGLNAKAAAKYPAAYQQASAKYPSPIDY